MTVLEGHKDLGTKKCNPCLVCMLQEQLAKPLKVDQGSPLHELPLFPPPLISSLTFLNIKETRKTFFHCHLI